jgi:hypothetical protein
MVPHIIVTSMTAFCMQAAGCTRGTGCERRCVLNKAKERQGYFPPSFLLCCDVARSHPSRSYPQPVCGLACQPVHPMHAPCCAHPLHVACVLWLHACSGRSSAPILTAPPHSPFSRTPRHPPHTMKLLDNPALQRISDTLASSAQDAVLDCRLESYSCKMTGFDKRIYKQVLSTARSRGHHPTHPVHFILRSAPKGSAKSARRLHPAGRTRLILSALRQTRRLVRP